MTFDTFHCSVDSLSNGRLKLQFYHLGDAMSMLSFWQRIEESQEFCIWFSECLLNNEWESLFWEMPPINQSAKHKQMECIVIPSDSLHLMATDTESFRNQDIHSTPFIGFNNLSGDAYLIAPSNTYFHKSAFNHLKQFLLTADAESKIQLWQLVANEILRRLEESDNFVWVNTSGLGVAWLHLRFDSRPKYYISEEYKTIKGAL